MNELTVGREPLQIVEIVQPYCVNRYGLSPCSAEVGVTGSAKCYNTRRNCQDPTNYDASGNIVWRFIKPTANRPPNFYVESGDDIKGYPIPSLRSVSTSPTEINIGAVSEDSSAFGRRASATIVLQDHQWDDSINDFYLADRNYIATDQGTFWGKWLARNPYYSGYLLYVYDGYRGQDISEMTRRSYVIDTISGPEASGAVKVVAKDPLSLTGINRDQYPRAANIKLVGDITESDTGITVAGDFDDITEDYTHGSDGRSYAQIDDEIISWTSVLGGPGGSYVLNGVQRGELGTNAADHGDGDRVQRVAYFSAIKPWEIVEILLMWAGLQSSALDTAGWAAEHNEWLADFEFTGTINEPEDIGKLVGEVIRDGMQFYWWDERDSLVKMKAIRPETEVIPSVGDEYEIVAGSTSIDTSSKNRISRVATYYDRRDQGRDIGDRLNYATIDINVDGNAESSDEYGTIRTREIFSRWHVSEAVVSTLNVRLLSKYRDNPQFLTVQFDAKDRQYWVGDVLEVTSRLIQNDDGSYKKSLWQIISAEEIVSGEKIKYKLQGFDFYSRYGYYMADDAPDFAEAADAEKQTGAWYTNDSGLMGDGSRGYVYI